MATNAHSVLLEFAESVFVSFIHFIK